MAQDEVIKSAAQKAKLTLEQAEAQLRDAKTAAERVEAQKAIARAQADLKDAAEKVKNVTVAEAEAMLRDAKTAVERVNAQEMLRSATDELKKAEAAASAAVTEATHQIQAEAANVKKHVVQKGESLSLIAKQYYGDVKKWKQLYEANKKTVGDNPDLIQPGMELVIPLEGV